MGKSFTWKRICTLFMIVLSVSGYAASASKVGFLTWQSEDPVVQELFPERHPDFSVEFHTGPGGSQGLLLEHIYVRIAANLPMDVILSHTNWLQILIDQDLLLDLRPYIERDGVDLDLFPPGVIQSFTGPEGQIYALPFLWTTILLAYNADIFDKSGVPLPTDDWDIFDMEEMARRLAIMTPDGVPQRWGLGSEKLSEYVWRLWGVPFLNERRNQSGWHDPKAVDAWTWFGDIMSEPILKGSRNHFANSQLAMRLDWPNHIVRYGPEDDLWDVTLHPKGPAGRVSRAAGAQWVIYRDSEDPEAAWQLVKFLASYEAQLEYLVRGLGGVHILAMLEYWLHGFDRSTSGILNPGSLAHVHIIPDAYAYASLEPTPVNYNDILRDIVTPLASSLQSGLIPAQSAVPEAARQIDLRLQQNE